MRTGGTAFVHTFEKVNDALVFYDPFNSALKNDQNAELVNSSNWNSSHPPDYQYFKNYFDLGRDNWFLHIPNLENFVYRNSSEAYKEEIFVYIRRLVDLAHERNKIPVFKFETMEGHASFLRSKFPDSLHIGITRDRKEKYLSWLEQLALGNSFFFDKARELIAKDVEFFVIGKIYDEKSNESVFDTYYDAIVPLRAELDIFIDLKVDSKEVMLEKFKSINSISLEQIQVVKQALVNLSSGIDTTDKFEKALTNLIHVAQQRDELAQQRDELAQQRDELAQQRDELAQQRDELTRQCEAIVNSRIWRASKPIRIFKEFMKN